MGRQSAVGEVENFNATSYIFNMKNRFKEDWRDRHDLDHTSSDGSMSPKEPASVDASVVQAHVDKLTD